MLYGEDSMHAELKLKHTTIKNIDGVVTLTEEPINKDSVITELYNLLVDAEQKMYERDVLLDGVYEYAKRNPCSAPSCATAVISYMDNRSK